MRDSGLLLFFGYEKPMMWAYSTLCLAGKGAQLQKLSKTRSVHRYLKSRMDFLTGFVPSWSSATFTYPLMVVVLVSKMK